MTSATCLGYALSLASGLGARELGGSKKESKLVADVIDATTSFCAIRASLSGRRFSKKWRPLIVSLLSLS